MGPTCAQRGVDSRIEDDSVQMSFDGEFGAQTKPQQTKPLKRSLPIQRDLPAYLRAEYEMAKLAFDDLFREFCKNGTLLYGERVLAFDGMLKSDEFEVHGLDDPHLDWLEPQHELRLFLSRHGRTAYHRRCINGTLSLLHFNIGESAAAKKCVEIIVSFCRSLRKHRDRERSIQLPLFEVGIRGKLLQP